MAMESVLKQIRERREIKAKDTDAISRELERLQKRQAFLLDHGGKTGFAEYTQNKKRIVMLATEIRERQSKGGGIVYHKAERM